MTKIYEALEQAKQISKGPAEAGKMPRFPVISSSDRLGSGIEKEMLHLYQNLNSILPDSTPRVIQFIGSKEGEGTSTIVREFGRVTAERFNKPVLLLDADRRHPSQHLFFDIESERGWDEMAQNTVPIEKAFYQVGRRSLFVGAITQFSSPVPQIFSNPGIDVFWRKLKQSFDLILIDSPPTTVSSEGLAICGKVDGVILVVEAEQVRWPVVQNTKENILRNGGKILGIVFNKRQHYIPKFIYTRL